MSETPKRRRAAPVSPEGRRSAIVAAALPLVVEYGSSVTTAQVARAAGIGEGTVFRVFPNTNALLAACTAEALRSEDTVAHLEAISLEQPLGDRLTEAAETMSSYLEHMGAVAGAMASARGRPERPSPEDRRPEENGPDGERPDREAGLAGPRRALAALFEPERASLRLPPEQLAEHSQLMLLSQARHRSTEPMTPAELVEVLLHGALTEEAE